MTWTARASASVTCTLASLAASSGLTVGRCTEAIDNSANLDEVVLFGGKVKTGAANLQAGRIEAWVFAEREDGTWPELFTGSYTGSDGGFTITERSVLLAGARRIACIQTGTTQRDWVIAPVNLCEVLGGVFRKAGIFIVHNAHTSTNVWSATAGDFVLTRKAYYRA